MRIAFLTGGLEPGRDGVGDYSVGLADELRQQGHEAMVVGLADKFATETIVDDRQGGAETLRLPETLPWSERVAVARQRLDEFEPDWISFQFVCYAYHPKGFVHGLTSRLAPLYRGRKTHIMFHEIWLCKEQGWGWKHCVIGEVQRRLIQQFARDAKPLAIHTSNASYADILRRSGIRAEQLGLFGNVPVSAEPRTDWIESELRGALGPGYRQEATWLFGMFGSLYRQWPAEPLLGRLHRAAQASGKRPVLASIGRIGPNGKELWNRISQEYADHFTFMLLGEQSPERISEYLSRLDFGIATTPQSIIGKSGSVIAMLEHGRPVIVNRNDAPGSEGAPVELEPQLIFCDPDLETRLRNPGREGRRGSRRPQVAQAFVAALEREVATALEPGRV